MQNGTPLPVRSICIPLRNSEEVVEVYENELPEDASEIIEILKGETPPLNIWLKFAVAYYRQGRVDAFQEILHESADESLEDVYRDSTAERVAILDALAAYYTEAAIKTTDHQKKQAFFTEATSNFNNADKIDIHQEGTWLGKGYLLLSKGDLERSLQNFDTVLEVNPTSTPALLGKARIYFHKEKYEVALKTFMKVLSTNPTCPPSVRLGVGFCLYRLDAIELAQKAFERVLQLDENNVEALVSLAVLLMNNVSNDSQKIAEAMKLLVKAYQIQSTHPRVLNFLANHFFYKGELQKVENLATTAFKNTEVVEIRAESLYLLGRSRQMQKDYATAHEHYSAATRLWPAFSLAQYGLGQTCLYKEDTDTAISCFEQAFNAYPDSYECLKILGCLYSQTGRLNIALDRLKRATEIKSYDWETWLELAQLQEVDDPPAALIAYERAVKIMAHKEIPIPMEVLNNIGVLRHREKNYDGARFAYKRAIAAVTGIENPDSIELRDLPIRAATVSTVYNIARLLEDQHEYEGAEQLYKKLLKEHPNYLDCYFRLGFMAKDKGNDFEASEWYKDALSIRDNVEAWLLLGKQNLDKMEWVNAQKKFEQILSKTRFDAYSLLGLANLFYCARQEKREKADRDKYLKRAQDYYWNVLQHDPSNIYAVNGIGMVMAEKAYIDIAKDIFTQVREALGSHPIPYINLGHIYFLQKEYLRAIQMYSNCIRKFGASGDVYLYLANAYYADKKYTLCARTLYYAVHLDPTNLSLVFNVALCLLHASQLVLKDPSSHPPSDVLRSVQTLKQARSAFQGLVDNEEGRIKYYSKTKATEKLQQCDKLLDASADAIAKAKQHEEELAEQRARQLEIAKEAQQRLLEKEEKIKMERKREKERQIQLLKEAVEKEAAVKAKLLREQEMLETAKKASKTKKRKRKRDKPASSSESEFGASPISEEEASSDTNDAAVPKSEDDVDESADEAARKDKRKRRRKVKDKGSRKRRQKEKEEKKGKRRLQVAQADETEESTVLDAEVQSAALEDLRKKRKTRQSRITQDSNQDEEDNLTKTEESYIELPDDSLSLKDSKDGERSVSDPEDNNELINPSNADSNIDQNDIEASSVEEKEEKSDSKENPSDEDDEMKAE